VSSASQLVRAVSALRPAVDVGAIARRVVQVTEVLHRPRACLVGRHTLALQCLGPHVDVKLQLVIDVAADA
jgi:hypothetical protein